MTYFKFEILHQSKKSRARVGKIHTPHGIIDTPNFVPVGTNGSLKATDSTLADQLGVQLMFCNTYHLMLHPGTETVKNAGGLHNFINRKNPIITDSGGFQVFSLAYGTVKDELKSKGKTQHNNSVLKITEDGVLFRSYRDGAPLLLTPETSVQAQKALGADIIIPFDELPPYHIDPKTLQKSLERTHRWETRSLEEHKRNPQQQAMYAVIHGGIDPEMRAKSCAYLSGLDFDGYAIGGSVGKNRTEMIHMLGDLMPRIAPEKPTHLLGIGDLPSLEASVPLGIDTFDSSHPTRCARHGHLFTKQGTVNIVQSKYKQAFEPIEHDCTCPTCSHYTKAYIHHLFKAGELTGYTLATIHNVHFMVQLMQHYRTQILNNEI
ncbi:MAG: tRNA guanosine(34) transglycosylase Tgt [Candidatus Babeliales bacterium]